jgi:type II secretory pathway pseudopilin PulG
MGYRFPTSDKTHKQLLASIEKRKKDEEELQNIRTARTAIQRVSQIGETQPVNSFAGSLQLSPSFIGPQPPQQPLTQPQITPSDMRPTREEGLQAQRDAALKAWMGRNYAALTPEFNPTPYDSPRAFGIEPSSNPLEQPYATDPMFQRQKGDLGGKPNEGMRAVMARAHATQKIIDANKDGHKVSFDLDPLGKELMITTPPTNEKTKSVIHLYPEQQTALDSVPGYADALIEKYPNHAVTDRPVVPEATFGESMKFMGNVAWQSWDVAEAYIFEPIAQTAVELLPGTEGGSWDPRKGFGLTLLNEGLNATTEKFRNRPGWQQILFSIAFDPSYILGGLGLLKLAMTGSKHFTKDVVMTALMKSGATAEEADNGAQIIMKAYHEAGAGSAGWMARANDGHHYTPQEILSRGGLDLDLDSPVPNRASVSDADFDLAWDEGIRAIQAENVARENLGTPKGLEVTIDQQKLMKVLENVEFDPTMRARVVSQLTSSPIPEVQEAVWHRFIRFTLSAMQRAALTGELEGAGRVAPFDRNVMDLLRRERDATIITKPPGGQIVGSPTEAVPAGVIPTVTTGSARGGEDIPSIKANTADEFADVGVQMWYGPDKGSRGLFEGASIRNADPIISRLFGAGRAKISRLYEKQQSWWLDKHAVGNAAAGRAKKNIIQTLNDYIDADIVQINRQIKKDFRDRGIPSSDPRVKAALVKKGNEGFQKIKRMPGEFDFELQAALGSGAAGAAVNHARVPYVAVRNIIKNAKSDLGQKLNVEQVNLYLSLMHGIDIVRIKNAAARARAEAEGKVATPTGQLHMFPLKDRTPIVNPASPTTGGSIYSGREYVRIDAFGNKHTIPFMQSQLWRQQNLLEAQTITRVENGKTITTNQWEEVKKAAKVVTDHYNELLHFQLNEGMITKEMVDLLEQQYKHYNPIKYVEGSLLQVHNIHQDGTRAFYKGVAESDLRALSDQGIDADVVRPLELIIDYTMRTYLSIFRNRAIKALIPTLMYDPRNAGRVRHLVDDQGELTTSAQRRPLRGESPDMMRVARMVNGKAEVWEIPKEFEPTVDGLVAFDQAGAERVLRNINKVPRSLLTAHNPQFFMYNFMHDMLASFLVEGIMPWQTGMALLRNTRYIFTRNDEFVNSWSRSGGWVGGFAGQSAEDLARVSMRGADTRSWAQRNLGFGRRKYEEVIGELQNAPQRELGREFRQEFSNYRKFRKFIESPVWLIGQMAEAVEQAPRRAVAEKVRRQGGTWQEAAYRGRRVTVDFQRRGRAMGLIDAAFLYTNAAVQGAMLPWRAGFQMGWAPRIRMAGLAFIAAGLYAWNTQDEYEDQFANMSATDKYTKLTAILGSKWDMYGNKLPVSIAIAPMLREFAVFSGLTTVAMEKLRGRSEQADWQQFAQTMIPQLNPLSQITNLGGRDAMFGWQGVAVPTVALQLLQEVWSNWDSYRAQPIVSEKLEALPTDQQYDAYTTRTARTVAGVIGWSPKKVDHLLRVGALRDVIYGVDMLARFFDEDSPDPEIEAMAYAFEDYLDLHPDAREDELLANPELSGTADERLEEWKSKNIQRVMGEFRSDEAVAKYQAVSEEEWQQMELILKKRWTENRSYAPDGAPIAFVTGFIDRLIRTQGGNKSRLGEMRATRAMQAEGYEVSVRDTRTVAGRLDITMSLLNNAQYENDGLLWGGQRAGPDDVATGRLSTREVPKQVGIRETGPGGELVEQQATGWIDGVQWIKRHQESGRLYAAAVFVQAGLLEQAAQLQNWEGKNPDELDNYKAMKDFRRDSTAWAHYKKLVATGAGAWEDTRTQAQYLASAYRGIQMTFDLNDTPDFTKFFDEREDFENMVRGIDPSNPDGPRLSAYSDEFGNTPAERDETWDRVKKELMAGMTITEREYYDDMQLIREFWDISRDVVLPRLSGDVRDTYEKYLEAGSQVRDSMTRDPVQSVFIKIGEDMAAQERYIHRLKNPDMDAAYIKWGYATQPLTAQGHKVTAWLDRNVKDHTPLIDAAIQERLQGRTELDEKGTDVLDMIMPGMSR